MNSTIKLFRNTEAAENAGAEPAEAVQPVGTATEAQLEEWKNKYPQGIFGLIIPKDDKTNGILYFRRPDRNDLNYSKTKRDPNAHDEQYRALAETICIGGDVPLLKDEQAMISVCYYMETMDVGKPMLVLNL